MKNLILNVSISEESLLVPDFTISVYGSSCNSLFFGVILASFLSLSMYLLAPPKLDGMSRNRYSRERKEEIMRPKKRKLHELPDTKMVKSGTIRLTFGWALVTRRDNED